MKAKIGEREFALAKGSAKRMPTKAGSVSLVRDGVATNFPVTSNAKWAKDTTKTLEYIWVEVGGVAMYLTLGYAEPAASLAGKTLEILEGAGPKPVARVTSNVAGEEARKAAFRATWKARNPEPAKPAEPAPAAPAAEPAKPRKGRVLIKPTK